MRDRRSFLRFLAASPVLAAIPSLEKALAQTASIQVADDLIANAADALSVFDFEPVARNAIPPAHWGFLAGGVDGDETLRANEEAYSRFQLRVRG